MKRGKETQGTQASDDLRQSAVVLAARGMTGRAIGEALGVTEFTVSGWRQTAWWRDAYNAELDRVRQSLDAALAPMLPKALAKYDAVLEDPEHPQGVYVAKDVLDRQYGRAVQREERSERRDIRIVVAYTDQRPDLPQLPAGRAIAAETQEDATGPATSGESDTDAVNVVVLTATDGTERGIVLADKPTLKHTASHTDTPTPDADALSRWIEEDGV